MSRNFATSTVDCSSCFTCSVKSVASSSSRRGCDCSGDEVNDEKSGPLSLGDKDGMSSQESGYTGLIIGVQRAD